MNDRIEKTIETQEKVRKVKQPSVHEVEMRDAGYYAQRVSHHTKNIAGSVYSNAGKIVPSKKEAKKIPVYGSMTSAWRYLAQKPKKRLKSTQRYTRVLEARMKLLQEQ